MALTDHTYQFSVGTLEVIEEGAPAGSGREIGIATDIAVSYDGDPQQFWGGDVRLPLAIELGNRTGEVSVTSTRWNTSDELLTKNYVNIVLGFGECGGGLTGTIQGAKMTNFSVTSTQNGYVTSDATFNIADPNHLQKGTTPPSWASSL